MPSAALLVVGFNSGVVTDVTLTVATSAGKCPAAPAAPLPGNFSQIFSQEISYFFAGNFCQNCACKD